MGWRGKESKTRARTRPLQQIRPTLRSDNIFSAVCIGREKGRVGVKEKERKQSSQHKSLARSLAHVVGSTRNQ